MSRGAVSLAIPCRTDEPGLGRTLAAALGGWARARAAGRALEVVVCVNGPNGDTARPTRDASTLAMRRGEALGVERGPEDLAPPLVEGRVVWRILLEPRAGKAVAWNVLRERVRGDVVIFLDADVGLGDAALDRLLETLARHPEAAVASPKTTCAAPTTGFERVMATPYRIDFPNLSGQLYAARRALLPARMPPDLFEPERWLELALGRARVVREPCALVVVRVPATFRDFLRQRIRIEMGKVQLRRDHPGLERESQPQPGWRAVTAALGPDGIGRLGIYLLLREACHVVAWWRFRRGRTAGVWQQASTTKDWGAA